MADSRATHLIQCGNFFLGDEVRDRSWKLIHGRVKGKLMGRMTAMRRITILTATADTDVLVIKVSNTLLEPGYHCLNYCYIKEVTDICKSYYSASPAFSEDERQKIMSR